MRLFRRAKGKGIVLALGGGGAAGVAHIGVLQVLGENNIRVRAVAGTSIGAEIGAFLASGMPADKIAEVATAFDWRETVRLLLPVDLPAGGLTSGGHITGFLRDHFGSRVIEDLDLGYVAVATDLEEGVQVVLDHGDVVDAVRASVSIPGLMAPVCRDGRVLADGGIVNPLPVDVAGERFGGPVVAVAVHAGARAPDAALPEPPPGEWARRMQELLAQPWVENAPALRQWLDAQLRNHARRSQQKPAWTTTRVLERVYELTQREIVRLRSAETPPDLVLAPDVSEIGVLEFYRAQEAIEAGRREALENLPRLKALAEQAAA